MTFSATETAKINAVKFNLETIITNTQMFWNGVNRDCVITGGYFVSAFHGTNYKDIDVFILNKNTLVYEHLTDYPNGDKWNIRDKNAGEYLDNPHIFGVATNTRTLIQYILTDYASREELLKSFDYKHTTVSYVPAEKKLYITRSAYDAIINKHLIVNGDNKPKHWREKKFNSRGWWKPIIDNPAIMPATMQPLTADELLETFNQMKQQAAADLINDMMQRHGTNALDYLTK